MNDSGPLSSSLDCSWAVICGTPTSRLLGTFPCSWVQPAESWPRVWSVGTPQKLLSNGTRHVTKNLACMNWTQIVPDLIKIYGTFLKKKFWYMSSCWHEKEVQCIIDSIYKDNNHLLYPIFPPVHLMVCSIIIRSWIFWVPNQRPHQTRPSEVGIFRSECRRNLEEWEWNSILQFLCQHWVKAGNYSFYQPVSRFECR